MSWPQVCRAPFRGVNGQRVIDAIQRKNKRHDLRVAYEIILDHKQSKARTQEVQMIMQVRQLHGHQMCDWQWPTFIDAS